MPRTVAAAPVFDPVVEAVRAAFPELDDARHDQVAAPHRRQGKLVRVSRGESPFAGCTADDLAAQQAVCKAAGAPCTNYPDTEIEPLVDANPAHRRNLIAGWQQDRWSNGGARGDVAGYSKDGGRTWTTVVPPGITLCGGGEYARPIVQPSL